METVLASVRTTPSTAVVCTNQSLLLLINGCYIFANISFQGNKSLQIVSVCFYDKEENHIPVVERIFRWIIYREIQLQYGCFIEFIVMLYSGKTAEKYAAFHKTFCHFSDVAVYGFMHQDPSDREYG